MTLLNCRNDQKSTKGSFYRTGCKKSEMVLLQIGAFYRRMPCACFKNHNVNINWPGYQLCLFLFFCSIPLYLLECVSLWLSGYVCPPFSFIMCLSYFSALPLSSASRFLAPSCPREPPVSFWPPWHEHDVCTVHMQEISKTFQMKSHRDMMSLLLLCLSAQRPAHPSDLLQKFPFPRCSSDHYNRWRSKVVRA